MFILKYCCLWKRKTSVLHHEISYLRCRYNGAGLSPARRMEQKTQRDRRGNRRDPTAVRNLSFLFPTLSFFAGAAYTSAPAGWRREVTNFFINMQRDTPNSLLLGKGNVVAGAKREKMRSPPGVHVQPSGLVCVCACWPHARVGVREK